MSEELNFHRISVDPRSPEPLYLQLADELNERIRRHEGAECRLPSQRRLAREVGCDRSTAARVYRELERRHVVEKRSAYKVRVRPEARLSRNPFPNIGVVVPRRFSVYVGEHNSQPLRYIAGITDRAAEKNISTLMLQLPPPETPADEVAAFLDGIAVRLDGVIHMGERGLPEDPPLRMLLNDGRIPQVMISASPRFSPGIRTVSADIGTGACEISSYDRGNLCFTETLKIGTLRMFEQIHGTYSPSAVNYYTSRMIDNAFSELRSVSASLKADLIIIMGSSARNLLKLLPGKRAGQAAAEISREEFFLLRSRVSDLSFEQLGKQFNLSSDLAETIQPCCMILDNLLRLTDAANILIPMTSTKFLLLQDFIDKSFGVPDRFEEQIHSLIMRTADRYRCCNEYCERTTLFAEVLFNKLEKLHGLGHAELLILKIAARLHKAGLYINNQSYNVHSGYIIRNTEIPGISVEQRRIAALTARYHRKEPPNMLHPEYAALPVRDRETVNKLAAILRLACALGSMASSPRNLRVKLEPSQLTIRLGDDFFSFPETMTDVDTAYFRSVYACRIIFA